MKLIKAYLKWIILGVTLFFIVSTFRNNWQAITEVKINFQGWIFLLSSLVITLLAHIWSAFVWIKILQLFKQSFPYVWGFKIYLVRNLKLTSAL